MKLWVRGRQLMGAMDAVAREWARMLTLDERDVYAVMLLELRGGLGVSDAATSMGRTRQQVQKTLLELERRNLVEVAELGPDGRVRKWRLSPLGERVGAVLRELTALWEEQLAVTCDVELLLLALDEGRVALVNCSRDPRGWRAGLAMPDAIERGNARGFAALEELERLRDELGRQVANDAPSQRAERRKEILREAAEAAEKGGG